MPFSCLRYTKILNIIIQNIRSIFLIIRNFQGISRFPPNMDTLTYDPYLPELKIIYVVRCSTADQRCVLMEQEMQAFSPTLD